MQVGEGSANPVYELYNDSIHNRLMGSGDFNSLSGDTIWGCAQWDGVKWDSLGSGNTSSCYISSFQLFNSKLIIGGHFNLIGNYSAQNIVAWDGNSWSSLSTGVNNDVSDMTVFNNELIVSGSFYIAGGNTIYDLAKWDDTSWDTVGITFPVISGSIYSLGEFNSNLYIGGNFICDSSNCITRLQGNQWRSVGDGLVEILPHLNPINSLLAYKDKLYIGGQFGLFMPGIQFLATWNDTTFEEVGGGLDGFVNDMVVFNDTLYVVGAFNNAGGQSCNNIAKWDGINWCSLGSSFNGMISTVEVFNDELYIGGEFTSIDGEPIARVAKWIGGSSSLSCGNTTEVNESSNLLIEIFPNPLTNLLTIQVPEYYNKQQITYTIFNSLGQKIITGQLIEEKSILDISQLTSGVYYLEVTVGSNKVCKKLLKL